MRFLLDDKYNSLIPAVLAGILIIGLLVPARVCAQQGSKSQATQTDTQEIKPAGVGSGESVVRGKVIYADTSRPLRRAEVTLFDINAGVGESTVTTNRQGLFIFEKVPAGRYLVIAEAPGIISPRAFLGRSDNLLTKVMLGEIKEGFSEVTVDGKGRVETEVRVRRGGVITGRVTADGEPVSGADVKLFRRERGRFVQVESTWQLLDSEKRALQTDSRGIYRIAGLPAGEYVVRVSEAAIDTDRMGNEPDAYGDGSLVITYYPSATNLGDAQVITVLEGSEYAAADVRMPTRDTHKIGGTVVFSRANEPAGFVDIKIDRADERLPQMSLTDVTARTDRDGKWEVDGIPDGEYIVAVGAGLGARVSSAESGGWVKVAPKRFTIKVTGTDITGLETRLAAGARLSGKVIVEGRKSLSYDSLAIEIIPAADDDKARSNAAASSQQRTNPQYERAPGKEDDEAVDMTYVYEEGGGTFEMDGLPAGKYFLRLRGVTGDRYYVKALTRGGIDLMRSSIKIEEGQNLAGIQVTLATDVATIEGRVTAQAVASKPSYAGIVVILMPVNEAGWRFIDGLIITRADNLGRFTLKAPPGEYFITALTRQQSGKESVKIDRESLMKDISRFRRITVRAGERFKAEELSILSY